MERRLTAILAADVVGYSRLMGEDEASRLCQTNLNQHAKGTGIVHISGVTDPQVPTDKMRDDQRVLVGEGDRLGNVPQLLKLIELGYDGPVSFEAFSPLVHDDPNPSESLTRSIAFLTKATAPAEA